MIRAHYQYIQCTKTTGFYCIRSWLVSKKLIFICILYKSWNYYKKQNVLVHLNIRHIKLIFCLLFNNRIDMGRIVNKHLKLYQNYNNLKFWQHHLIFILMMLLRKIKLQLIFSQNAFTYQFVYGVFIKLYSL